METAKPSEIPEQLFELYIFASQRYTIYKYTAARTPNFTIQNVISQYA